jgi:copper chaperone CopZ
MKKSVCILLFLHVTLFSIAQFQSGRLQASGLTCAMCAKSIYNNLIALDCIDSIDTDLNASVFLLKFKLGKAINPDIIRKKVEDAGFSVALLDLNYLFSTTTIAPDAHLSLEGQLFHFMVSSKETISGLQTIRIIDKNFLTEKAHKKLKNLTSLPCYTTGMTDSCCVAKGLALGNRIFHVQLIKK